MSNRKDRAPVFVFGASGHAKVVIDAIERAGRYEVLYPCDDSPEKYGLQVMGYTIARGRDHLLARRNETTQGIVAIGANRARMQVAEWLTAHGCALVSAVHPHAAIARDVAIGAGTLISAGPTIVPSVRVGAGSTVLADVPDGARVGGSPCRPLAA